MKLLTINTHSLLKKDSDSKLKMFADAICDIEPDVIAMQEVNQSRLAKTVKHCGEFGIKSDNYALKLNNELAKHSIFYNYVWEGMKHSYCKYDEGLAVFSKMPIEESHSFYISSVRDVNNWKTRMALGILSDGEWFYSIHMGRYDDSEECFAEQWRRFCEKRRHGSGCWVMGDFNCPDNCDEYKRILDSGWYDTFDSAMKRDDGFTVIGEIDGWRKNKTKRMRIDYVLADSVARVFNSNVIFNGKNYGVISDHFGVLVTVE